MVNQSKNENIKAEITFAHVDLDKDFPITEPQYGIRHYNLSIGAHIHDCLEIGYCYDGEGYFQIGSKILYYKKGDAVIINRHEFHLAWAKKNCSAKWGFIYLDHRGMLLNNLSRFSPLLRIDDFAGKNFINIISGETQSELARIIRQIFSEQDKKEDFAPDMIRTLVWQMLILLNRSYPDAAQNNRPVSDCTEMKIIPALNYINKNITQDIKISKLASLCCTSEANFRKIFNRTMNISPREYVIRMRLNIACSMLLEKDNSIIEIASACGFNDISNFNRQFFKHIGCTPREFRNGSFIPDMERRKQ